MTEPGASQDPAAARTSWNPVPVAWAALALLAAFSLFLAYDRIYQVDETMNVYMARILGLGATRRFYSIAALHQLGPLAWAAAKATSSEALYHGARFAFLAVFWVNLGLMALASGAGPRAKTFAPVLLAAATLPPLWDYGFEIRHDNLMVTALLLAWWALRRWDRGRLLVYPLMGFLAGLMQFMAFKSFLYTVPLAALALALPPPRFGGTSRLKLAAGWAAGLAAAVLLARLAYGLSGHWEDYVLGLRTSIGYSQNPGRFAPWPTLLRFTKQAPLLCGAMLGVLLLLGAEVRRKGRAALDWDGPVPEALLLLIALAVFLVNPVPYAYNLVLLVPFGFLAALTWIPALRAALGRHPALPHLAAGLLLLGQGLPFLVQTARHLDYSNERQNRLMAAAEALTDPAMDRVYDAAGLVATRDSIDYTWFLHTLALDKIRDGRIPTVRRMLENQPPAVLMPNYRFTWISPEDEAFIARHYLPLAGDFRVLGALLPEGGGTFTCLHPGRYLVFPLPGPQPAPAGTEARVDGAPLPADGILRLEKGEHRIVAPPGGRFAVAWIGPRLRALPAVGKGDAARLFVNWY